jgi:hypothetical protein
LVDSYKAIVELITMPKRKPDQVITHRIELQSKEREALEALVIGQTAKNLVIPVAVVAGVGTASYIGYKAAKAAFGWGEDIVEGVQDILNTDVGVGKTPVPIIEALLGKSEYTDSSGQTFKNPAAGIPFFGPLFGAGINFGIAVNPVKVGDETYTNPFN